MSDPIRRRDFLIAAAASGTAAFKVLLHTPTGSEPPQRDF